MINNAIDWEKHVAILKENKVYRVADIFYEMGTRWEVDTETIARNKDGLYSNFLLYNYLKYKTCKQDLRVLKKLIHRKTLDIRQPIPSSENLVIHVRLGDITDSIHWPAIYNMHSSLLFRLDINYEEVESINIVTALHFGANDIFDTWHYSELAKKTRSLFEICCINKLINLASISSLRLIPILSLTLLIWPIVNTLSQA